MQIKSRESLDPVKQAKTELAEEVAVELDDLVDKLDSFLEMRIAAEFDELKADILQVKAVNEALIEENQRFRDQITVLLQSADQAGNK